MRHSSALAARLDDARKISLISLLMALAIGLWVALQPVPAQSQGNASHDFSGRVSRVIDGDTFRIAGMEQRIRVWGLDAPELSDPGGAAATQMLVSLIGNRPVRCKTRDIDRFGRIVGQCWLHDGRDMARAMIESGTASEFCRFSRNYYGTCGRR